MTLVEPVPEPEAVRAEVLSLFAAAIDADPAYAPSVICGDDTVEEWFDRKKPVWSALTFSPSNRVIGHVAVQERRHLPGGTPLPIRRSHELCRLTVHPDHRGRGLATRLVRRAHAPFGPRLWATAHTGSPSHRLMLRLGWSPQGPVAWYDDPLPGVALFAPTSLTPPTTKDT